MKSLAVKWRAQEVGPQWEVQNSAAAVLWMVFVFLGVYWKVLLVLVVDDLNPEKKGNKENEKQD